MITGRAFVGFLAGLTAFSAVANAQSDGDYHRINVALTEDHIVPRYQGLAQAAGTLHETIEPLCADTTPALLAEAQTAFHEAMDAWMAVQHLSIGPVELQKRRFRLQFWPDKHNTASRQMSRVLAARNPGALRADVFHESSVAIQGFPALERVLFGGKLIEPGDDSRFQCDFAAAIAGNLTAMASAILAEWTDDVSGHAGVVNSARFGNDIYFDAEEVTTLLFEDLDVALLTIADLKLARPLGQALERAKPRRAESWRSERSLRNVRINIDALSDMYQRGFKTYLLSARLVGMDSELTAAFAAAREAAAAIDLPLSQAVSDPVQRAAVIALQQAIRDLQGVLRTQLAAALQLRLGFNAQDGD